MEIITNKSGNRTYTGIFSLTLWDHFGGATNGYLAAEDFGEATRKALNLDIPYTNCSWIKKAEVDFEVNEERANEVREKWNRIERMNSAVLPKNHTEYTLELLNQYGWENLGNALWERGFYPTRIRCHSDPFVEFVEHGDGVTAGEDYEMFVDGSYKITLEALDVNHLDFVKENLDEMTSWENSDLEFVLRKVFADYKPVYSVSDGE